jgi:hypothetical protein
MTMHLWNLAYLEHDTCSEKRLAIREAIKEFDAMNTSNKNYPFTRRDALCSLATLPMITLGLKSAGSTVQPAQYGKLLAHCATSIEACLELHKSREASDLTLAFQCVSKYLPILEMIANDSSQYQREALDMATRCALVKALLGSHRAGPAAKTQYAKQAVALSQETNDITLKLSAYRKLAWAYLYDKKYMLALTTAQEAENALQKYPPISQCAAFRPFHTKRDI